MPSYFFFHKGSNFDLYDGPDIQCEKIITNHKNYRGYKVFHLTTYQAIIMIYQKIENSSQHGLYNANLLESKIMYNTTHNIPHSTIWLDGHNKFVTQRFPLPACNGRKVTHCIVQVKSVPRQGVNITINNMFYNGPSMFGDWCIFGGIALYSKNHINGKLRHVMIACEDIKYPDYPQIFSSFNESEFWISLTAYKPYGNITVELSFTYCISK